MGSLSSEDYAVATRLTSLIRIPINALRLKKVLDMWDLDSISFFSKLVKKSSKAKIIDLVLSYGASEKWSWIRETCTYHSLLKLMKEDSNYMGYIDF